MARRNYGDNEISETGNWNVAMSYSEKKIMQPLILADEYEELSKFGTNSILEELLNSFPLDEIKIKSFRRLIDTLIVLINNSIFAVRKSSSKDKLLEYKKELLIILNNLHKLYKKNHNESNKTTIIRLNDCYEKVLKRVVEIKSLINEPLNENDLIFTFKKEFDPKAWKEGIKERMTSKG